MLSIVIPVLRDARHLDALLPEIQRFRPAPEIVVVDGGSDDGSAEVARRHAGVRLVTSPPGRARQMNAGAAVTRGDTLLFLHADTRLPHDAPRVIADALGDPRVVGGRFDVRFDSPRPSLRMVAAFMNVRSRLSGISTGDQAIFVRRAAFEALGGYPDIALMEDIELTRRLKRLGRLAAVRRQVTTSGRRWERDGVWRTIGLMWLLRLLYFLGTEPDRLHRWYYGVLPAGMPGGSLPTSPAGREAGR